MRDAAKALDLSEANVKVLHHRARRAMAAYDSRRRPPTRELRERTRQVLERLLGAPAARDERALEGLLAADVRSLSDGGGEFVAARVPIVGREKVAHFWMRLAELGGEGAHVEVRILNGMPAFCVEISAPRPGIAPRFVLRCEIDDDGRVTEVHSVFATRKLHALRHLRSP